MLQGKIALVTGASKGIGRAIAVALGREGAHVIVNYNGSTEQAGITCKLIKEAGGTCESMRFNVAEEEPTMEAMKNIIEKYGKLDILVNNAGITRDGLIMRMTDEDFESVLDVNLKGAFHTIRAASKQMLKQRSGRIINITSVSGIMGNAGQANYSASKAGLIGLTKATARELASRGITVNAVAPGFIETDMTDKLSDTVKENACKQIPLGKMGNPTDIAEAVLFLASEKAAYITGQVLCVDGGMAM
ncbi:MAG: 3-oxoacyl-[acyl-carrier-protein] reductase [Lachnospiraceae bacterium]|nr:3-oxoacyl-[acyl-carrier-protein] reductase [Lachnospiraceae bacterium]